MKDIHELNLPEDLHYTEDHEWAMEVDDDTVRIGINDYAQDQMGDIVYVGLPEIGEHFEQGEEFGTIESVKAVSEAYMPIGGEVVAVNTDLEETPELVNEDPYDAGWMIEIKPADIDELESLMDVDAYLEMLKGSD